ncbi:MAG: DUF1697 domain-containing protein [Acidimicrobiia bacterium]|nr:DUF1697 domain-containing protein [Acidimicrobiia bacterium]
MPRDTHLALLRGINVGGKNKVEMPRLRSVFEGLGYTNVETYINTGNVIFTADGAPDPAPIEQAILDEFALEIPVLVRTSEQVATVIEALPDDWQNDERMKCDVMFLWDDVDDPSIVGQLDCKPGIDDVRYVPGALLWKVDRPNLNRSGMRKIVGSRLYRSMTVRNVNTVRKLANLMDQT